MGRLGDKEKRGPLSSIPFFPFLVKLLKAI